MANAQTKWRIDGEYFESCNCEVLCPCILTNAQAKPTEGHCDAVVAWQVSNGSFGATDLAGLRAAIAIYAPGPMVQGNWTVAVYVDERGSAEQRAALEAIFTGAAGGPLSVFAPLMSKKLPTKAVPITFSINGDTRKLSIAGISTSQSRASWARGRRRSGSTTSRTSRIPGSPRHAAPKAGSTTRGSTSTTAAAMATSQRSHGRISSLTPAASPSPR